MWTGPAISIFSKITIHAKYLKVVGKVVFYNPTRNTTRHIINSQPVFSSPTTYVVNCKKHFLRLTTTFTKGTIVIINRLSIFLSDFSITFYRSLSTKLFISHSVSFLRFCRSFFMTDSILLIRRYCFTGFTVSSLFKVFLNEKRFTTPLTLFIISHNIIIHHI